MVPTYKLVVNPNLTLSKQKQYYFSNAPFNILAINNKNLLKVFAKGKNKIENYLQSKIQTLIVRMIFKKNFSHIEDLF
jgi:hypothetical protein